MNYLYFAGWHNILDGGFLSQTSIWLPQTKQKVILDAAAS